jgi:hypothetical protein
MALAKSQHVNLLTHIGLVIAELLTMACNAQWHLELGNSFNLTESVVSDPMSLIRKMEPRPAGSLLNESTDIIFN